MIGKKSKFAEHERKSKSSIQNEESSNRETSEDSGSQGDRKEEKRGLQRLDSGGTLENSKLIRVEDVESSTDFAREYSSPLPAEAELGKETQENEAKTQEALEQLDNSIRSARLEKEESGDQGISTASQQKLPGNTPTIIKTQNLKSDSDLLWDEICNGVVGKNSGIPMGFNRLNKYLGLRKSIYTTIGAAAG